MPPTLNVVDTDAFVKAVLDMQAGKTHVAEISNKIFEIKQYETFPLSGYVAPEGFPECCEFHRSLVESGVKKLLEFPNCCDPHKKLLEAYWFSKADYQYLPKKLVSTVSYTCHCIEKSIDNNQWFKEITDYIDYTAAGYGQFPEGYGSSLGLSMYLNSILNVIKDVEYIPVAKKPKLIEYVNVKLNPKVVADRADLNLLIGQYREWLKIFPFELSLFKDLKSYFESQMPVLKGVGETNMYTGLTGFHLNSKKEMMDFLVDVTRVILNEINSFRLFQKNRLKKSESLQLEIILANRKLELDELAKSDPKDKNVYVKLLKKWFKSEKKFLSEIGPFIQKTDPLPFIQSIISGIHLLQKNDTNEPCIMNVRNDLPDKESAFRYWFKNFLTGRYPDATISAEEEKGDGRMDLKITDKSFSDKIVEFKGWWNYDKKDIPQQICNYLTDFEREGYVFLINHCRDKDITCKYKDLITKPGSHYIPSSWTEYKSGLTDFTYYESRHSSATKEKTIFHFIFNVYF